ncbi:DUF5009 domain-containing protein [Arcticibacter sp. MXS-1]|uniref:DUF5009 domain-containing protein n=1 Tax=Arcticibacter sp. MXS-1 TaxID=3341726 RepID=UPI0035A8A281
MPKRLLSIDVFRAITMFLMIFVNDVAGVRNIPGWIEHTQAEEDGMGFADTIFPAFLFIVGLSLPWALRKRMERGDSSLQLVLHVASRSLALIVMGFYHVNLEAYSAFSVLPKAVWGILITLSFFLIWLDYSKETRPALRYGLQGLGVAILMVMALFYRGGEGDNLHSMQPSWWGILGIIGWAYLVSALVFTLMRGKLVPCVCAALFFLLINVLSHMQLMPFTLPVVGDASSITLIMTGAVVSLVYNRYASRSGFTAIWTILAGTGCALILFGFFVRPFSGGISKILATPAWVTICAGISTICFLLFIWLVDIRQKQNWFRLLRPAGTSTLTCYLMPYLLYFLLQLLHVSFPAFLSMGTGGILRSFLVSFFLIQLVGLMEKKQIRLRI